MKYFRKAFTDKLFGQIKVSEDLLYVDIISTEHLSGLPKGFKEYLLINEGYCLQRITPVPFSELRNVILEINEIVYISKQADMKLQARKAEVEKIRNALKAEGYEE